MQYKELRGGAAAEGSEQIRERVLAARERQQDAVWAAGERTGRNGRGRRRRLRGRFLPIRR